MRLLLLTALGTMLAFAPMRPTPAAEPAPAPAKTAKAPAAAPAEEAATGQVSQRLVQAFERGDAKQLAALFLPQGELIDEGGNAYRGAAEIEAVFARFFAKFSGVTMQMKPDSLQPLAPGLVIEDGLRTVVTKDGAGRAETRYTAVYAKQDGQWKIASIRENAGEAEPTAHERLLPLSWFIGEWVDEQTSAAIRIHCRWSEDGNFLLVDFNAQVEGKPALASQQRIGWDPLTESVRSWVFDSDGGYGEGRWTQVEDRWVIKSTAVLPDGVVGSATVVLEPTGKDKFVMKGRDRILGSDAQPDFETTIVRRPPQPSK